MWLSMVTPGLVWGYAGQAPWRKALQGSHHTPGLPLVLLLGAGELRFWEGRLRGILGGQWGESPEQDQDSRGGLAGSSPRKWLTQSVRSALGMLQMVEQRRPTDRGCSTRSLEPVSSLSYFTPLSRILATWEEPTNPSSEPRTPITQRGLCSAQGNALSETPHGGCKGLSSYLTA